MDFGRVLKEVVGAMETAGLRYALIGGFAMSLRRVQRATADLDFILALEDLETLDALLERFGYRRVFRSENVSHYDAADSAWGRIDILHAFRKPSLGMLQRAEPVEVEPGFRIRVARVEDIIGLKVQAMSNNPARTESDVHDIRLLVRAAREQGSALDWELLRAANSRPTPGSPGRENEPPRRRLLTPREYIEIATFASRLDRSRKSIDFSGTNWKL